MSRAKELDQFYTSRATASACWGELKKSVKLHRMAVFLEPSAGDGAFFELLPQKRRIGLDLDPKHPDVAQGDFLRYPVETLPPHLVTVGNPPFGKNSSLAVRFFNHAAKASEVVAFIVPMTFRKPSVTNRLDPHFHLVKDVELARDAFVFEGSPYSVPCCFQVWVRSSERRAKVGGALEHPDFRFVDKVDADFAIRRVGAVAGRIFKEFAGYSAASNYFIKAVAPVDTVIERLSRVDWTFAKENNAGNPSISKRELVRGYLSAIGSEGA